jgi:hypothetical protein
MANTLIPIAERSLSPDEVEALDKRRRFGQLLLVLCFQTLIISCLLLLWSGQDATVTHGWVRPMVMWNTITFVISVVSGLMGIHYSRGRNEFFSF